MYPFFLKLVKFQKEGDDGGSGASGSSGAEGVLPDLEDPAVREVLQKAVDEATKGLKRNNAQLIEEKRRLQAQMEKFKDFDPEEYQKLREKAREAEERKKKEEGDFESLRKQLLEEQAKKENQYKERESFLNSQLEKHLIESELVKAITEAKGRPNLILHAIRPFMKVVEEGGRIVAKVVDENGNPRYAGDKGEPMTPAQLVEEFRANEAWARAFDAPDVGGSGSPGQGGSGAGGVKAKVMKRSEYNKLDFKTFQEVTEKVRKGELRIEEG